MGSSTEANGCMEVVRALVSAAYIVHQVRRSTVGSNRAGIAGGPNSREEGAMMSKTTNKFSLEVRERAVRMVQDHLVDYPSQWAA
jgi:hypothetical protein